MKHPIDSHLGSRIRQRRWILGLTQEQLGQRIGLTFRQIHRYEAGLNQISACRLWEMSHALDVHISFFFRDFPSGEAGSGGEAERQTGEALPAVTRAISADSAEN